MAGKDNRSPFKIKMDAAKGLFMWHFLPKTLDLVLLSEYPKSGGTWLGTMLSEYLDLPFPRHKAPAFEKSIMHGHKAYNPHFDNHCVVLHRDGRDVMVSLYYHLFFNNQYNSAFFVDVMRKRMPFKDYNDIQSNFLPFLEYMQHNRFSSYKFSWNDFVMGYKDKPVLTIKYEDLLTRPVETLTPVMEHFSKKEVDTVKLQAVIEKNSFANVSAKYKIEEGEKSFLRKGVAGDWRNTFSNEHHDFFLHHNKDALQYLHYETK